MTQSAVTGSSVTRMATNLILLTSIKKSFALPETVITAVGGVSDFAVRIRFLI